MKMLKALVGAGEKLPVKDASMDAVLCKVALPYTDEAQVIREIGRVLKPGAQARLYCHAGGYYLRYLMKGESWKFRVYAIRTFINTWVYRATGSRLPGFVGDTIYQSLPRLREYYRQSQLRVIEETTVDNFWGKAVFIYHCIQKLD